MNAGAVPAEDRLDIRELLFSDDASLEGDEGTHRGKEALATVAAQVWESEGASTRHLTLNAVLAPVAGNRDAVVATFTLLIVVSGEKPKLLSVSAISQLVVKSDGAWRITRRTVNVP